jgi:hypothetical protein
MHLFKDNFSRRDVTAILKKIFLKRGKKIFSKRGIILLYIP